MANAYILVFDQSGTLTHNLGRQDFRTGNGFAVGDIDGDGDGRAEVLVADQDLQIIKVFKLSPNGTTRISVLPTTFKGGDGFAVGDIDGDGKEEILVAHRDTHNIEVFNNHDINPIGNFPARFGGRNDFAVERRGRDSDGDGLLDTWETNGLKNPDGSLVRDHNGRPVLPPGRANPRHKDLFVEVDYMASHQLKRDTVIALKAAFAVAPKDAGGITNPDGLPGITLWIDAGSTLFGGAVGDDFGGSNEVTYLTNISGFNPQFFAVKDTHFDPARRAVFRYCLSSASPNNNTGKSTGGNTATTLNDTNQSWFDDKWKHRKVTIQSKTGEEQTRTVTGNSLTRLAVSPAWDTDRIPDATYTYSIELEGGVAQLGGNAFIVFQPTIMHMMHELGHTMGLQYGGDASDHGGGARVGGGTIVDFSPPRTTGSERGLARRCRAWTKPISMKI